MRLIRGAPGSGKTRRVFSEFKAALRAGETNIRIVVPTATLVRHFQHELARDGVVFSPRSVVSLSRFLAECAGKAQLVPDGLLRAIVSDCLRPLSLPEFAAVSGTEGMADLAVETINLFENAGCTPGKLASVKKLGPLAKSFEKLWRSVSERVRQCGYELRGNWIRAACAGIPSGRVWMDGFLNFSPAEKEFLSALARTCELTVTIGDFPATSEIHRFALTLGAQDQWLPGTQRRPRTTVARALSIEREADEIARRIIELHKQGTDLRNIAVALRDAATYVPLLKGTFVRFGIPARFYFPVPLRRHPAAIFLSGLLSAALSGWNFEATLGALRAHPALAVRPDFDRFDFAVRAAMAGNGAAGLLKLCESDWLREEIAACLRIESWISAPRKPAEWVQRLESFASKLYRPGLLDVPRDRAAVEAARSHVAGLRAWLGAVDSVAAFWTNPNAAVPFADFWGVASLSVEASVLHPVDDRANVVHVMDAWEARQWDVSSLFVCGMTDQDFPRKHVQNLLFPDGDIDLLRRAGVMLRKTADYDREEEWLFDALKTRAADSLILTYPEHDAAGKSVQRSRLIEFDRTAELAELCRPAPRVKAPSLAASGRIASPELQAELVNHHQSVSMTSLEDLAQCRFKFFSRKTLSLESAPERPDRRLQPRITGLILHAALEEWLQDRARDFVAVFEEAFEQICRDEHIPPGYRLEVDRIAYRDIARRVSANDLWTPDSSEVEVPLSIEFPGGVQVNGRVDRIDRFGGDCVIVDYKSSKTANVEKLVTSATRLQGPLYALAVREKLHLNPVAMIFWAVREDERYGWGQVPGITIENLQPIPENWTSDAKARTIERLSGFLAGQVHAHPENPDDCRWCDYASACRVEQALVQIGAGPVA